MSQAAWRNPGTSPVSPGSPPAAPKTRITGIRFDKPIKPPKTPLPLRVLKRAPLAILAIGLFEYWRNSKNYGFQVPSWWVYDHGCAATGSATCWNSSTNNNCLVGQGGCAGFSSIWLTPWKWDGRYARLFNSYATPTGNVKHDSIDVYWWPLNEWDIDWRPYWKPTAVPPYPDEWWNPQPVQDIAPQVTPEPRTAPKPNRARRTSKKPDKRYSPSEQTQRGPIPVRPPGLGIAPQIAISPEPQPVRWEPNTHRNRPPSRQDKERKVRVDSRGVGIIWRSLGELTELFDYLDAFHDALPWYRQCGGCTVQRRLEIVYEHFDEIDLQLLFENLIINEIEDRVIGGLNRGVGRRFGDLTGRPVSPSAGPLL